MAAKSLGARAATSRAASSMRNRGGEYSASSCGLDPRSGEAERLLAQRPSGECPQRHVSAHARGEKAPIREKGRLARQPIRLPMPVDVQSKGQCDSRRLLDAQPPSLDGGPDAGCRLPRGHGPLPGHARRRQIGSPAGGSTPDSRARCWPSVMARATPSGTPVENHGRRPIKAVDQSHWVTSIYRLNG